MFCNQCGTPVADGARFCPKCGNKLAVAPAQPVYEAPVAPVVPAQPVFDEDLTQRVRHAPGTPGQPMYQPPVAPVAPPQPVYEPPVAPVAPAQPVYEAPVAPVAPPQPVYQTPAYQPTYQEPVYQPAYHDVMYQPEYQPQPKKKDKKWLWIVLAVVAVVGIIVGLIVAGVFDGKDKDEESATPESVAEGYVLAEVEGRIKDMYDYMAGDVQSAMEDNMDPSMFGVPNVSWENLYALAPEQAAADLAEKYGEDYEITVETDSVEDMDEETLEECRETASSAGEYIDADKIEEGKLVIVTVTIEGSEDEKNYDEEIVVVKYDGEWKVFSTTPGGSSNFDDYGDYGDYYDNDYYYGY